MAPQGIPQASFTSGELAPALYGRVDFARYYSSLKTCRNFIVRPYGGVINRAGTYLGASAISAAVKGRLIPFVFSSSQSYALEFGDYKMRVFKDGGLVVYPLGHPDAGDVVEVVTPFPASALQYLKIAQSNDVMTITHPFIRTQELIRFDHHLWTMRDYEATGGPFQEINVDKTIRVTVSAISGPVVVDCNSDIFSPDLIDSLFYVEADNDAQASTVKGWEVNVVVSVGDQRRAGVNFYEVVSGGMTGTVRPSTIDGTEYDGDPGVLWKYLHSGSGIVKLTGMVSRVTFIDSDPVAPDFPAVGDIITNGSATAEVLKYEVVKITGQTTGTYGRFLLLPITGTLAVGAATSGAWSATFSDVDNEPASCSMMMGEAQTYIPDTLVPSGANTVKDITAATVASFRGFWAHVTVEDHGYAVGNVVTIYDTEGLIALNGIFSITSVESVDVFVVKLAGDPTGQSYTSGGKVESLSDGASSYKWAYGSWSDKAGFPGTVGYDQERMIFAGSLTEANRFWMSRTQGYKDFGKTNPILDDDAINYKIMNNQHLEIRHIVELSELILFTTVGPFLIRGTQDGIIKPGAISRKKQPSGGCSHIEPVQVGAHALYVQEKGNQVRSLGYNFADDAFTGQDLTALSHHLFLGRTIVSWCYQNEPFSAVWVVLDNGLLLSLAYLPEQEVIGWSWHDTDGLFESCCCITEDGIDRVYLLVKRGDQRFVERMAVRLYTDPKEAFFVDCGLSYRGVPADEISGLDHLEGKTVSILADGNVHPQRVVAGGKITLDREASVVHVGLPYMADFETLELATAQQNIRDKEKLITHVSLIVKQSRGIWVGGDADHLTEAKRSQFSQYEDSILETTGLIDLRIQATWSKKGNVFVRQRDPLPLEILTVIPEVTNGGS